MSATTPESSVHRRSTTTRFRSSPALSEEILGFRAESPTSLPQADQPLGFLSPAVISVGLSFWVCFGENPKQREAEKKRDGFEPVDLKGEGRTTSFGGRASALLSPLYENIELIGDLELRSWKGLSNIGGSGLNSLETRVHRLVRALDGISYDLALSTGRIPNTESAENTCCKPPGAEFLSSKFWRRTEGRCSTPRFSSSGNLPSTNAWPDKDTIPEPSAFDRQRFQHQSRGAYTVNPGAEIHGDSRGHYPDRTPKSIVQDAERVQAYNASRFEGVSPANCIASRNMSRRLIEIILGILEENTEVFLAELSRAFGPWMVTHVIELLTAGTDQSKSLVHEECYNLGGISIAELHRLVYAQVLSSHPLTWQIAPIYLLSCMKQGMSLLEILMSKLPTEHNKILLKNIEICCLYELDSASSNLTKEYQQR